MTASCWDYFFFFEGAASTTGGTTGAASLGLAPLLAFGSHFLHAIFSLPRMLYTNNALHVKAVSDLIQA